MAFSGTAVITQVSDRKLRITGLTLIGAASGTIGLQGATGTAPDVRLPASFVTTPYDYGVNTVPLVASIDCQWQYVDNTGVSTNVNVAKTGTAATDFRITVSNPSGSTTSALELYVEYH